MSRRKRRHSTKPVSAPAETGSPRDPRLFLAALAIGVIALVAYSNSFNAGLVFDNRAVIETDPRIHSWSADTLRLIFTREYWWPEITSNLYRPVTTLSYWANYTLLGGGASVTGYHAVNFLVHWANAALVLVLANRLGGSFVVSVIAAALFAVHPINTEAVTNIVGRADLLATFSVLLGAVIIVRTSRSTYTIQELVALGACAFIGVFAKETAIVIGVFVLLYQWLWLWPTVQGDTRGARVRSALRAFTPVYLALAPAAVAFVVARTMLAWHSMLIGQQFADNPIAGASWFSGFMTAWFVIGKYAALMLFPYTLSNDYSYRAIPLAFESASAAQNAIAVAVFGVTMFLIRDAWHVRKRSPFIAWAMLFFVLAQIPTSNLVVPIGSIMAERFMYLPGVGFCVLAALSIARVSGRSRAWAVGGVIVGLLGARTFVRNKDWDDELSLWRSAVAASPSSFRAHKAYASALLTQRQDDATLDSAIASAERGLAIVSNPPLAIEQRDVGMFVDLGVYYRVKAQQLKARAQLAPATDLLRQSLDMLTRAREVDAWRNDASRAMRIKRGVSPQNIADVGSAPVYHELGDTYLEMGDWAGARAAARYAQTLSPEQPRAYVIEGVAYFYARHPDSAAVPIAMALLLDPQRTDVWENLTSCFVAMREPPPVSQASGRFTFDATPRGRALVNAAAVALVQRFDSAKRHDDARAVQSRLMREFNLPATAFGNRD